MTDTEQVLKLMTPKQAEVWGLIFDGYQQFEIAEMLRKGESAVSRLADRGRKRAKKKGELLKICKDL